MRTKMDTIKTIERLIREERERQDAKWGEQNHSDIYWLGILIEEVGELARDIIDYAPGLPRNAEPELVEVAAVAHAWLEAIERRET